MSKPYKLKSGNTTPFKMMGSSPLKQAIGGGAGEAVSHWLEWKEKAKKTIKKVVKKGTKLATKAATRGNILTLMLGATKTATADQPTKGKGKVEYPGGEIDFTKE